MKRVILTLVLFILSLASQAQEWTCISSKEPANIKTELISSSEDGIKVNIKTPGFYTYTVTTPRGDAKIIASPKAVSTSKAGEPDLPMIAVPAIISDTKHYSIRIVDAHFTDFENYELAPSKGDFSREIDPKEVPFVYGEMYNRDVFFPTEQAGLYEPYILRDFRGQNMVVYPFAYNAVTKTLRVYYDITIEIFSDNAQGDNTLHRKGRTLKLDSELKALYANHFINYEETVSKYTALEEEGDLLIICHDAFLEAMTPFVNWKKQTGRQTTIIGTGTIGASANNIKDYITAQYNSSSNLTHVLLVGDCTQIPGKYVSTSGGYSGYSDLWYGQLEGDDFYNELFIGRFSAESLDHVTTQVEKVIHYERDASQNDTWFSKGIGVGKNDGPGHFGEYDWQHIDNIRGKLLNYHYDNISQEYQNVSGYNSSAGIISQHWNEGASIINYCNHGSETAWGVFSYNVNHINALTNGHKLPFMIVVACLNGKYDHYQPCFAEVCMRATDNNTGEPTGAIGGMFSYISQPWMPPMYGQDEMIDILVESYSNNIRRTMGGVTLNGNMKILDQYGSQAQGTGTYNTWILYGDPTLTLRNMTPTDMGISHNTIIGINSTQMIVNATNGDGARATLTRNNEIMGSAVITDGICQIPISAPIEPGTATLTVFGYNKITYIANITITDALQPNPISVNCTATPTIIAKGQQSTLNAIASGGLGGYLYQWDPAIELSNPNIQSPTASPSTTRTYTCTVSDGEQSVAESVTIIVVCPPTNLSATIEGNYNIQLTWDDVSPATSYNVYRDNIIIARGITDRFFSDYNLDPGNYLYSVSTNYGGVESPKSNAISITISGPLTLSLTANPTVIVEGESCTLLAQPHGGTGNYTYLWSPEASLNSNQLQVPIATPAETTTYTCTVTSGSESIQDSITVIVVNAPTGLSVDINEHPVINWTSHQQNVTFNIYRGDDLIAQGIDEPFYTDEATTPCPEEEYCYSVSTVYLNTEAKSDEACASMPLRLFDVEDLNATYYWNTEDDFGIHLTWALPSQVANCWNLTGFKIHKNQDTEILANIPYETGQEHFEYFDNNDSGIIHYTIKTVYERDDVIIETTGASVEAILTAINENLSDARIYPNPTTGLLTIESKGMEQISLYNVFGQEVLCKEVKGEHATIDLGEFTHGIYLLRISSTNKIQTKQIVVK